MKKNLKEIIKDEVKVYMKLREDSRFANDGDYNPGNTSKAITTKFPGNPFQLALIKIRAVTTEVLKDATSGKIELSHEQLKSIKNIDILIKSYQSGKI